MMNAQTATQTFDLVVLYAHAEINDEGEAVDREAMERYRDVRHDPDPQLVDEWALENAYRMVVDTEVEVDVAELLEERDDTVADLTRDQHRTLVLEHLYSRMQGANVDEEIGYHGAMARSAYVGDLFLLDDEVWMADRFGFTEVQNLNGADLEAYY